LPLILLNQQKCSCYRGYFDIYPDTNYGPTTAIRPRLVNGAIDYTAAPTNSNQFTYSRNVSQFGQNGRFIFARLSF
jgi:iron complex outermembrane receptor protein